MKRSLKVIKRGFEITLQVIELGFDIASSSYLNTRKS